MRKWLALVSVLLTGVSCIHDPELKDEQNEIEVYCDALLEMALDEPADAFRYAFLLDAALSLPEGKQEEALDRIPARLLPDGSYDVQGRILVRPSGGSLNTPGASWTLSLKDEATLTLEHTDNRWCGSFRSEGRRFSFDLGMIAPVESTIWFPQHIQEIDLSDGCLKGIVVEGVRTENDGYRAVFRSSTTLEMEWGRLNGSVVVDFYHGPTWMNSCTVFRSGQGVPVRYEHRH